MPEKFREPEEMAARENNDKGELKESEQSRRLRYECDYAEREAIESMHGAARGVWMRYVDKYNQAVEAAVGEAPNSPAMENYLIAFVAEEAAKREYQRILSRGADWGITSEGIEERRRYEARQQRT